jgi:hypothetical protein
MHAAPRPFRSPVAMISCGRRNMTPPPPASAHALPAWPGSRFIPRPSRHALPLTEVVRLPTMLLH